MVEFTLPKNSKVFEGRIHKDVSKTKDPKILKIYTS